MAVAVVMESAEQALAEVRRLFAAQRSLAEQVLDAKDELERRERQLKNTKSALQNAQLDLLRLASVPVPEPCEVDDLSSTESLELFCDVDRYDHAPSSDFGSSGHPL